MYKNCMHQPSLHIYILSFLSFFLLPPPHLSVVYKSLSVSALRQGPQTFPDDPTHPLPPLILGCSRDRARLALESVAKVHL